MKRLRLGGGHRVRLLENGEEFFPRLFEKLSEARREILIETFIVACDEVGKRLQQELIAAAQRGVRAQLTVDGYGAAGLPAEFMRSMTDAGVAVRWFDPRRRWFGLRTNLFRRLHRKLVVVDGHTAFIGGINFGMDHLRRFGPQSKQDYAAEVQGPVVAQVREAMEQLAALPRTAPWGDAGADDPGAVPAAGSGALAALVLRDNDRHRQDIEHLYRLGIRRARREIIIANAYFFPGYRLLRDLRQAAQRGVTVHLVLQGRPDMRVVKWAAAALHDQLLRSGVRVYEYRARPLHGKVAVIDQHWATVGSSNLDPLSLFLNLEANLVVRDRAFAGELRRRLSLLMERDCEELRAPTAGPGTPLRSVLGFGVFHLLRRLPQLAGWLPAHADGQRVLPHAAADAAGKV